MQLSRPRHQLKKYKKPLAVHIVQKHINVNDSIISIFKIVVLLLHLYLAFFHLLYFLFVQYYRTQYVLETFYLFNLVLKELNAAACRDIYKFNFFCNRKRKYFSTSCKKSRETKASTAS